MAAGAPNRKRKDEFDQALFRWAVCAVESEVVFGDAMEAGEEALIGVPFQDKVDAEV